MRDYLAELAGPQYVDAILWTLAALVLLVIVLLTVKGVRAMNSGTFVAGGRARKTRLAVMDATAIDSQRRLVLVRRDDVEHLLLIGGPTDVVVEQDIRVVQRRAPEAPRQPAPVEEAPVRPEPSPSRPPPQLSPPHATRPPTPPSAARTYAPETTRVAEYPRPPAATASAPVAARPATPVRPPQPAAAPKPAQQPVRVEPRPSTRPAPPSDDLDEALLSELDLATDDIGPAKKSETQAASLDDEMAKLLGELSSPKR